MKRLIIWMIPLLLVSCQEDLLEIDNLGENAEIIGTWVREGYDEPVTRLKRRDQLNPSEYGFIIMEDGTFIERKNSGWCATPPIAYKNYNGTWEAVSDSLLDITVGYWGGTVSYQIRIVSLDIDLLTIRYLYADQRKDAR